MDREDEGYRLAMESAGMVELPDPGDGCQTHGSVLDELLSRGPWTDGQPWQVGK